MITPADPPTLAVPPGRSGPVRSVGPQWTGERLRWALPLMYGTNSRGATDTNAVATALGVSRSSVYRWLARPDVEIPEGRAAQIVDAALPDAATLVREQQAFTYAVDAIDAIRRPRGRGVLPSWREQGWLEPHLVAALDLKEVRLLQLATTRISGRGVTDLKRRGEFADFTTVPTRFHATALIQSVLDDVRDWRIQARALRVGVGPTRTWSNDAPTTDLDGHAAVLTEWLEIPSSQRGTFVNHREPREE